jgi:hypothetical protein
MSKRLFFGFLAGVLSLWFCAAICTTAWTNDLYTYRFCSERWFGALLHSFFILAVLLDLWFGRDIFNRSKVVTFLVLSSFCGLLYFSRVWPSVLAAFVRAPWAKEGERGPAMSAPSDYSLYTWEWDVGRRGVAN